jgi:predicted nucleic acid-binding protein
LRVVCNSSPLILLAKIHQLDLLPRLYQEVVVPVSVLEEIRAKPGEEAGQIEAMLQNQEFQLVRAMNQSLNEYHQTWAQENLKL